jgi:hypothetical protein
MNRSTWSMSEDDLDIWERALERHFSAMDSSPKTVDIVDDITSKCPVIGPRYVGVLFLYLLTWTWCSFPVNTALGVALAILRRLNLNEGDSIPTRTLSYLNMTLTASYPPQPSTIDTASELIKAFHRTIISVPVSLLEPVVFAVQAGLAVWLEDDCVSLSVDQYNGLVRNLSSSPHCLPLSLLFSQLMPVYDSLLTRLPSASPNYRVSQCPRPAPHRGILAHCSASTGSDCVYTLLRGSTCPSCWIT